MAAIQKHLINFLYGAGDIFLLLPQHDYRDDGGFLEDARMLHGDFRHIGDDIRKALKRDQQAYERTRQT